MTYYLCPRTLTNLTVSLVLLSINLPIIVQLYIFWEWELSIRKSILFTTPNWQEVGWLPFPYHNQVPILQILETRLCLYLDFQWHYCYTDFRPLCYYFDDVIFCFICCSLQECPNITINLRLKCCLEKFFTNIVLIKIV